jgi:hypothetical protein
MSPIERPSWLIRAGNRLLAPVAERWVRLDAAAVRRRAERSTGLSDWGDDPGFDARAAACCEALQNGGLSPIGRIAAAIYYHIHAANRLRIVDQVKRDPGILETPIERPIFIVGWYRTGSTFLHTLLAADPRHRAPRAWELFSPAVQSNRPGLDRQLRRLRSLFVLGANRWLVPEQGTAHHIPLDGPEECFFLLENDFVSSTAYNTFAGYRYAFDLLEQDLRPTYRFVRQQLQLLGDGAPQRRWILKSPFHLWHLDELLDVFPDARIVFVHRTITESLPSNCSLSAMTTSKFVESLDLDMLGRFWSNYYRVGMDRAMRQRARIPAERVFDLPLGRLASDPVGTIEDLYRHFGLDFEGARAAVDVASKRRVGAKGDRHVYNLEAFGLDETSLRQKFSDYEDFVKSLAQAPRDAG